MSIDSQAAARQPLSTQVAAQVRRSFARQGALIAWDAQITRLAVGECEIALPMNLFSNSMRNKNQMRIPICCEGLGRNSRARSRVRLAGFSVPRDLRHDSRR